MKTSAYGYSDHRIIDTDTKTSFCCRYIVVEMLEKQRQAYTSLEAVYLLTPCMESVQRLMDDYPSDSPTGKYKAAHILFTARTCHSSSIVSLSNGCFQNLTLHPIIHFFLYTALEDRLFNRLTQSPVSKYIKTLKELFIDFTGKQ